MRQLGTPVTCCRVQTSLRFLLRGIAGEVQIDYGVNEDPDRWGYPVLALESFDLERARGCPVIEAKIRYPGEGYAAVMGWIQLVRHRPRGASGPEVLVDVAPQMHAVDAGMPYFAFGPRPVFFDAPGTDDRDYDFRAHAFLTASPDAVMSPVIEPLCGFSWGYDVVDANPQIAPLKQAGREEWSWMRSQLEERYPGWTFLDYVPAS